MIRSDYEYQAAIERLNAEKERFRQQRDALKTTGLSREEIERVVNPLLSFHEQLAEEIEAYEKSTRGEFEEARNFEGIGRLLVAIRIFEGLTQRELAERLGIHESQVSRDERNEYHGMTIDRATRVLDALGVELRTTVVASPRKASHSKRNISTA